MRISIFSIIVISGLIISSSCTTLKRYNSLLEPENSDHIAGIDLFGYRLSAPKTGENGKSLWDLSADAQSQFIKILNIRYPDNEQFINSLNMKFVMDNVNELSDDYTKRDVRMVFSVSKVRDCFENSPLPGIKLTPADRIEYIRISFKIRESSVLRFTGWNMFSTEYGSIDVGDMSFNRSIELGSSSALTSKKDDTGAEISAGGTASLSRKEEQSVRYRYLKLNGRLNDSVLIMEEEGTREIDLTGNIIADVALEFNKFPVLLTSITGLKDSTGRYNDPEKIRIEYSYAAVPFMGDIKDTIHADMEMFYVYRNVVSGSKTFPEWDDQIKYYYGTVRKAVTLFTANEYVPELHCIGTYNDPRRVKIITSSGSECNLLFRTYQEGAAFYDWLRNYFSKPEYKDKPLVINGHVLKYGESDLIKKNFEGSEGLMVLSYY